MTRLNVSETARANLATVLCAAVNHGRGKDVRWVPCEAHVWQAGEVISEWLSTLTPAETKLSAVREYVADPGNWSALDGRRQHLLNLIDGTEATA